MERRRGGGGGVSPIGWILLVFDLNGEHRKLCQTFFFSFKYPLFFIILFYFPFLFVWCWKSLWAFPPQWRELWSAGEAQLSSLSLIFPLLTLSAEEWGVTRSTSSQAFSLFKPDLSQICCLLYASVCALSQEGCFCFLFNRLSVNHMKETELAAVIKWQMYRKMFLFSESSFHSQLTEAQWFKRRLSDSEKSWPGGIHQHV